MRFENLATRLFFGAAVAALVAAAIPSRASASDSASDEAAVGCGGPGSPVCATTTKGSTTFYDYYN